MSNEMQHTEGKWDVKNWADGAISIVIPISEKRFLGICQIECCDSRTEMEANAKLIAAAPDLLEALTILLEINEKVFGSAIIGKPARYKAKQAILKATHAA